MDTALAAPNRRVDMWYEGTAPQNRLTVGFRFILVIPQFIVLLFLYIAAIVAVFIGWFGALFTGRLPQWVHTFATGVIRWSTRVNAYATLLTDRYPPFSLEDEAYPARPMMPAPGPLNRWSVLFRWVLVIPGAVFAQIVRYGLTFPLIIVAWFIVLIGGSMPPVLYAPYSALVRYEIRLYAWFWMLTSEYSWGMLGDQVAPAVVTAPAPPPPPPPPGSALPGPAGAWPAPGAADDEPSGEPGGTEDVTADAPETEEPNVPEAETAPPQYPPSGPPAVPPPVPTAAPGFASMPPPSPWERVAAAGTSADEPGWGTIVLTGAARGWMIAAIVWGSVLVVAQTSIQAAVRQHSTSTAQQFETAATDVNGANAAILAAADAAKSCTTMSSVAPSQQQAATALSRLADDLEAMSLPDNATSFARAVESDASQLATIFNQLAAAPDCATYRKIATASNFATVLNSYPSDTVQLLTLLRADEP